MRMAPLAEDAPIWPGRRLYASRPWIAGSIDESGAVLLASAPLRRPWIAGSIDESGAGEVDSTEGIGEETCNGKEKKRD